MMVSHEDILGNDVVEMQKNKGERWPVAVVWTRLMLSIMLDNRDNRRCMKIQVHSHIQLMHTYKCNTCHLREQVFKKLNTTGLLLFSSLKQRSSSFFSFILPDHFLCFFVLIHSFPAFFTLFIYLCSDVYFTLLITFLACLCQFYLFLFFIPYSTSCVYL